MTRHTRGEPDSYDASELADQLDQITSQRDHLWSLLDAVAALDEMAPRTERDNADVRRLARVIADRRLEVLDGVSLSVDPEHEQQMENLLGVIDNLADASDPKRGKA